MLMLLPAIVVFITGDAIESDINDLKAAVIEIFRTLLEVFFKTVDHLAKDGTRKSVRTHIVKEAEAILFPRIKMFYFDSNLKEGYYMSFRVLSLQPSVEMNRKAAEYWYYVFETTSSDFDNGEVTYTHDDVDRWIHFFCDLGDELRDNRAEHAAAVKYYGTAIHLLRSMISRRNVTLLSADADSLLSDPRLIATEGKLALGQLQLGRNN